MPDYQILGLESVNYVNKQGREVNGVKVHLSYMKDKVDGLCVENVFVKSDIAKDLIVGMSVRLLYNRYGSVAQIEIIE